MLLIRFAEGQRLPGRLPGLVQPLLHGQALGQLKDGRHERRRQLTDDLEVPRGIRKPLLLHAFLGLFQPGSQRVILRELD